MRTHQHRQRWGQYGREATDLALPGNLFKVRFFCRARRRTPRRFCRPARDGPLSSGGDLAPRTEKNPHRRVLLFWVICVVIGKPEKNAPARSWQAPPSAPPPSNAANRYGRHCILNKVGQIVPLYRRQGEATCNSQPTPPAKPGNPNGTSTATWPTPTRWGMN